MFLDLRIDLPCSSLKHIRPPSSDVNLGPVDSKRRRYHPTDTRSAASDDHDFAFDGEERGYFEGFDRVGHVGEAVLRSCEWLWRRCTMYSNFEDLDDLYYSAAVQPIAFLSCLVTDIWSGPSGPL
jgi:hypothetical protein